MSEDKKEEIKEEGLERRLERRFTRKEIRREHLLETIIPDDRFTKTADFVGAIITGEIISSKITGVVPGAPPVDEPRLFGDRTETIIPRREREPRIAVAPSVGVDRAQTKIIDESNYVITSYYSVINSSNRGVCSEIALRSPSNAFSLSVTIDDIKQFDRTYDVFEILSPQSTLIDAFVETHGDELYVLHIGELSWRKSCQAIIRVTESITFANIFVNMKEFLI